MEIKLIIKGNPVTKKNSSQIVMPKGKGYRRVIPSKSYLEYEKEFIAQCMEQHAYGKHLNESLNIKCVYYRQKRVRVDLTNLLSATMDCLVSAQVIEDDNYKIASSNDGSRVYFDKENPRVEITITEFKN